MTPRVVITGLGLVSPIGNGVQAFMAGVAAGKQGIGLIRHFSAQPFPSQLAAEVHLLGETPAGSEVDRKAVFLEQALAELLTAHEKFWRYSPSQRLLIVGSGLDYFDLPGYINSAQRSRQQWHSFSKNSRQAVLKLAAKYDIQGGVHVQVAACVASNHALGLAFRVLQTTSHKIIIAGGADSMINPLHYMGFYKLGALSNWTGSPAEACRPFDKNRGGLVLGEGAAVFALQAMTEAEPQNILAEIVGYSSTMDAYTVTDPHPEGIFLAKAAQQALTGAGITAHDIDCVHLHGTGTPKNDVAEAKAMKLIFGERFSTIPVFSLKGQVGHLIGACGAIELAAVIYSLQTQSVPVTVNFTEADPDIPLRVVVGKPLTTEIRYLLKLNAAFGGQNAAMVLKKYE